jgi:dCMP deaminase
MRPTRDQMLMDMAVVVASRGTCSRARVGAILARDARSFSMGYNGAPSGMPHCNHTLDEPSGNGCPTSVHAEANAIVWAAREGVATDGSEMYTTHMPCLICARLIINAGIIRVVWSVDYRDHAGHDLLMTAGIELTHI